MTDERFLMPDSQAALEERAERRRRAERPPHYTGHNPFDPHAFPFNCDACLTPVDHAGLCDDCYLRNHGDKP